MNESPELLPCPCCGGHAQFSSCVDYDAVFCVACGLRTREHRGADFTSGKRKTEAAGLWNTRSHEATAQVEAPC